MKLLDSLEKTREVWKHWMELVAAEFVYFILNPHDEGGK